MPKNIESPKVTKGALFPGAQDVAKIVKNLQTQIQVDPKLAKNFKSNPRGVLGALGLNEDVQTELLRDAGITAALPCVFTKCIHTCWFTKCILTHIVIKH
jgi:hypothetical protein